MSKHRKHINRNNAQAPKKVEKVAPFRYFAHVKDRHPVTLENLDGE